MGGLGWSASAFTAEKLSVSEVYHPKAETHSMATPGVEI
jgi:hypothetical protein